MYRALFRLVLMRLPAEVAHRLVFGLLRAVAAVPGVRGLLGRWCGVRAASLRVRVFGRELPGPVGLAAGFDKDARGYEALGALGFGFVEVGTLTPLAQAGNPRPRMWRLPEDRALLNRLGFNNGGSAAAVPRLDRPRDVIVGVNVGKSRVTPPEEAVADYVLAAEQLGRVADYLVVNVSSPNTPGLRALQRVETLRGLLGKVRAALEESSPRRRVPLLVKIDPDLPDADIDAIADLAVELGLEGVIATNTTVAPVGLRSPAELVGTPPRGGVSGAPLKQRSLAVLRRLRERVGSGTILISVGGVETADDVWERIRAGATLVQLYTALVYQGPLLPRRLHLGLLERLRAAGFDHIQQAVGSERMN